MPTSKKPTVEQERSYLAYLLVSLIFLLVLVPIFENSAFAATLLRLGITAVLITAAVATRRRRPLLVVGLFVAAVAAPVSWLTMFVDAPMLFLFSCLVEGVFFMLMAGIILKTVIQKHLATVHSILGAICGYLMLGLAWAIVYWGVDRVDNTSLEVDHLITNRVVVEGLETEVSSFSQYVYFSFVTMSTLGYGDITPRTPLAQTLTWTQAVVGQFYLAALVAWLISEIPRRKRRD